MTTALIHLNDIALLTSSDGEFINEDAGLALLLDEGLKIGNDANALAKLHPRKVNDNFWQSPSIEPLKAVPSYVRHHADLIYHHLSKIHQDLGAPENILLAVPSSLNAEQLSYILGVADALPFIFVGLCDLAVAGTAYSGLRGSILHYEMQRHQTVITLLQSNDETEKKDVIVAPNLGLHAIQNTWTNIIADNFIEQSRFNPMHTAESEQNLFNQLPQWIEQLTTRNDLSIEFSTDEKTYEAKLERQQFILANDEFIRALSKKGQELIADAQHHLASHRLESLMSLSSVGSQYQILSERAVTRSMYEHQSEIRTDGDELPLVTRLINMTTSADNLLSPTRAVTQSTTPTNTKNTMSTTHLEPKSPTHLLVDNTASALPTANASINLKIYDNHLITTTETHQTIANIAHTNNQLLITSNDPVLRLNNKSLGNESTVLESGDILSTAGGLSAQLITVVS